MREVYSTGSGVRIDGETENEEAMVMGEVHERECSVEVEIVIQRISHRCFNAGVSENHLHAVASIICEEIKMSDGEADPLECLEELVEYLNPSPRKKFTLF